MKAPGSFLRWVLVGAFALLTLWAVDSCRDTKGKLAEAEARYQAASAAWDVERAQYDAVIAESRRVVAAREERIKVLESEKTTLLVQIDGITSELANAQEPPTTEEQERLPIVIFLRLQLARQEARFNLAKKTIDTQEGIILELRGVVKAQDEALKAWEAKYSGEHSLRLAGDQLFAKSKQRIAALERGLTVRNVVVGVATAGLIYLAVK